MKYIDLESIVVPERVALLDPVRANRNIKAADKIAANIAEKEAARLDEGALDPYTNRIVAIWGQDSQGVEWGWHDGLGGNETLALASAWDWIGNDSICGFRVDFDLRVMVIRSWILGVTPHTIDFNRYRSRSYVDLMQKLTCDWSEDQHRWKSLKAYCRLLGVDVPEDDCAGKDIGDLVAAGEWDQVEAHVRADVARTAALAERLGVR
ncbi:MAG TPA: hypothetical protein VM537_16110 [Anaerolineae bacterium]|nr:hypothetical protein [Anaerolineae bacterium]HUX02442.1 hypothetical protein [Phycisphaerae bacterium]